VEPREWTAAGLYDPSAAGAAERLALLDYLHSEGVPVDELQAAAAEGRLVSVLGDRQIQPGRAEFTVEDASTRSGLSADVLTRLWLAVGLSIPPESDPAFSEADIEALLLMRAGVEQFGLDAVLQLARVLGTSLARIAEAEAQTVMLQAEDAFYPTASSPIAAAKATAALSGMLPAAGRAYEVLHRHHVAAAIRRFEATVPRDAMSAQSVDVAVGFADLVGFSGLAEQLDLSAFANAIREFAAIASDVVSSGSGRVVKLMGDEVMFVAADASRGTEVALGLLDAFADHPVLPQVRAAVAAGRVVSCDGDYFGSIVNTAARLVNLANPNVLLATAAVATPELRSRFTFETIGAQTLRGLAHPVEAFRVRPKP
jgi:class 3 adenylate cyclase